MANVVIANAFLGEPLRIRDVMGGAFVIIGVGFIGGFSPYNPEPLTGERLHELVAWPGAITIYCVYGLMMLGMLYVVRKYGHTSVYYHILLTSAIGSFSVISSRPVATFTLQTLAGAAAGTVDSRLQAWVPNKTVCEASDGFGDGAEWRLADPSDLASVRLAAQARAPAPLDLGSGSGDYSYVPDALTDGYGCYYLGIGQLHHPSFWVFLLLLIISAFAQLKYLNDALRLYSYADVIPYHYACFTTLSVLGSMIVFKEFQLPYYQPTIVSTEYSSGSVTATPVPTELTTDGCPKFYELHFFLDGLGMTFMGVYFLVTMRDAKAKKSKGGKYAYDGLLEQVENGEQPHASVDLLEETEGAEGGGEQPEETATARTDVVEIHLGDEEFADSNGGAAIDGQRSSNLFEEESPPLQQPLHPTLSARQRRHHQEAASALRLAISPGRSRVRSSWAVTGRLPPARLLIQAGGTTRPLLRMYRYREEGARGAAVYWIKWRRPPQRCCRSRCREEGGSASTRARRMTPATHVSTMWSRSLRLWAEGIRRPSCSTRAIESRRTRRRRHGERASARGARRECRSRAARLRRAAELHRAARPDAIARGARPCRRRRSKGARVQRSVWWRRSRAAGARRAETTCIGRASGVWTKSRVIYVSRKPIKHAHYTLHAHEAMQHAHLRIGRALQRAHPSRKVVERVQRAAVFLLLLLRLLKEGLARARRARELRLHRNTRLSQAVEHRRRRDRHLEPHTARQARAQRPNRRGEHALVATVGVAAATAAARREN